MHWPWPRFPVTHQTHLVTCVAPAQGTPHWATRRATPQGRQQPAGSRGAGHAAERPGQSGPPTIRDPECCTRLHTTLTRGACRQPEFCCQHSPPPCLQVTAVGKTQPFVVKPGSQTEWPRPGRRLSSERGTARGRCAGHARATPPPPPPPGEALHLAVLADSEDLVLAGSVCERLCRAECST